MGDLDWIEEWLRNYRGYGKDQKARWAPDPVGFGQEKSVMVAWLQHSLKYAGGRWLLVFSLSMGQSDWVPACLSGLLL